MERKIAIVTLVTNALFFIIAVGFLRRLSIVKFALKFKRTVIIRLQRKYLPKDPKHAQKVQHRKTYANLKTPKSSLKQYGRRPIFDPSTSQLKRVEDAGRSRERIVPQFYLDPQKRLNIPTNYHHVHYHVLLRTEKQKTLIYLDILSIRKVIYILSI